MSALNFNKNEEEIWKNFVDRFSLSQEQQDKLKQYLFVLLKENEKINLTTITSIEGIIQYHFADSLEISKYINFKDIRCICDVGTGGGFPGIPLKILFPHLNLILIEVVNKKIRFLQKVIHALQLDSAQVYSSDWRTFLRKTEYHVDLFCARASLQPEELVRLFKPSCIYKDARLFYWAAAGWEPSENVAPFVKNQEKYKVGNKKRKFVFLSL
ncbi:16S rRNA (guanine(527)-N(7))-methyltransferase RsmG [Candidatus Dependentiae bacterium]